MYEKQKSEIILQSRTRIPTSSSHTSIEWELTLLKQEGSCKNTWLLYNFEFYADWIDKQSVLEYGVEAIGPDF